MSEANTPQGTDLNTAQNAIRDLMRPTEDNATEPEALEVEAVEAEAEMPEEAEEYEQEYASEDEGDLGDEGETDTEEQEDASFDILAATVEVDGEEITVDELRRGNLRHRDYTRKTQELAEARKEMEAQYSEIERERAQYAQMLPALEERLMQPVEQEPDWDTLYDTDPAMAAKAERQWNKQQAERQAQLEAVQSERQRMAQLEQQRRDQLEARYFEEQRQILPEIIPEWRDGNVAAQEAKDIRAFLMKEGFAEQDVNGLKNATLVKLARKAMLYDKGQTRATEAKKKPKTQKAKTLKAGSRNSQPKPRSEQQQALQRARQTGRVQDAAAAIKSLL